jgi:hypothetical protein
VPSLLCAAASPPPASAALPARPHAQQLAPLLVSFLKGKSLKQTFNSYVKSESNPDLQIPDFRTLISQILVFLVVFCSSDVCVLKFR